MSSLQSDYDRIIRPIEQQMMRSVWRITQNADDADDAFQEAMTQIWQRITRIRDHPNPQALVLKISCNAACDLVRRRARRDTGAELLDGARHRSANADAAARLMNDEIRDEVKAAIAHLPEQQAAAVTMRFLLYCSYADIAAALECAESTARVHVARGLERLRGLLSSLNPPTILENQS